MVITELIYHIVINLNTKVNYLNFFEVEGMLGGLLSSKLLLPVPAAAMAALVITLLTVFSLSASTSVIKQSN